MQVTGGTPIHGSGGWNIPGTAHRETPTQPAPMTIVDHGRPEQTYLPAQPAAARGDTLAEQIFRGIQGVNDHPEDVAALDVYDVLADQLVAQHQAEVDAGKAALSTALTPEAQTAAQRTWTRDQKMLDALATEGQKAEAITEAIKSAADNPARLAVYAEEGPAYLRAAGVDPSFLDQVFAQVVPGQAERVAKLDLAKQERNTLKHAVSMVRKANENGSPSVGLAKIAPAVTRLDPDRV